MKVVSLVTIVSVLALAACQESSGPTEPLSDDVGTPSFTVTHLEAHIPFDLVGLTAYVECANDGAGEWLEWVSGSLDTFWWVRITPSGNQLWNVQSDYRAGDPIIAVGQDSGDVWTLVQGEGNSNWVRKAGVSRPVNDHFQATEWYVNQDGDKLKLHQRFSRQRDLDGNIKNSVFVETWACTGKPLNP